VVSAAVAMDAGGGRCVRLSRPASDAVRTAHKTHPAPLCLKVLSFSTKLGKEKKDSKGHVLTCLIRPVSIFSAASYQQHRVLYSDVSHVRARSKKNSENTKCFYS